MVKTEEKKLIIILSHPCPLDALEDLQTGIIEVLKYQYANYEELSKSRQKLIEGNHLLLELLQATLEEPQKT